MIIISTALIAIAAALFVVVTPYLKGQPLVHRFRVLVFTIEHEWVKDFVFLTCVLLIANLLAVAFSLTPAEWLLFLSRAMLGLGGAWFLLILLSGLLELPAYLERERAKEELERVGMVHDIQFPVQDSLNRIGKDTAKTFDELTKLNQAASQCKHFFKAHP